jgi:hypothetical protein
MKYCAEPGVLGGSRILISLLSAMGGTVGRARKLSAGSGHAKIHLLVEMTFGLRDAASLSRLMFADPTQSIDCP